MTRRHLDTAVAAINADKLSSAISHADQAYLEVVRASAQKGCESFLQTRFPSCIRSFVARIETVIGSGAYDAGDGRSSGKEQRILTQILYVLA